MASRDENLLRAEVVLGQWCRTLFSGLVSAGVRHVVVSPGSRSTPLVMQALREPLLECHSVLDERSAGFFALGLASLDGPPPLLICTSGTALAHYLPAVIEARMSGLPLLVLSADRPAELQECGAAQTIAQDQVLSPFARSAPPLGSVSSSPDSLRSLLRKSIQVVALSQGPLPGPVHLNFPVAKPLEIADADSSAEQAFVERVTKIIERQPILPPRALVVPSGSEIAPLVSQLVSEKKRTCVTLGPTNAHVFRLAQRFAELLGAPLLCELSPVKDVSIPLDTLCAQWQRSDSAYVAPERIVHLGLPCISSHWLRFLEASDVELWCVPGPEWKDPSNRAQQMILGDLESTLGALNLELATATANRAAPRSFPELEQQLVACEHVRRAAWSELTRNINGAGNENVGPEEQEPALPELVACHTLLEAAPAGGNVLLGNSLSLRLAAWSDFRESSQYQLFVQRGVNGIDGQIARGAGIAAGSGRPTLAILGDVTAAHDLGSLLVARDLKVPLVIAVIDNNGGRLFDHLPLAKKISSAEDYRFWTTPPRINWSAAAMAYGIPFESCSTVSAVYETSRAALLRPGVTLLHLPVESESTHSYLKMSRTSA